MAIRDTYSIYLRNGKWIHYVPIVRGQSLTVHFERTGEYVGLVGDGRSDLPEGFPPNFDHPTTTYVRCNCVEEEPYVNLGFSEPLNSILLADDLSDKDMALKDRLSKAGVLGNLADLGEAGIILDLRTDAGAVGAEWFDGRWEVWPNVDSIGNVELSASPRSLAAKKADMDGTIRGEVTIRSRVVSFGAKRAALMKVGERWIANLGKGEQLSIFARKDDVSSWIYLSLVTRSSRGVIERRAYARKTSPVR